MVTLNLSLEGYRVLFNFSKCTQEGHVANSKAPGSPRLFNLGGRQLGTA